MHRYVWMCVGIYGYNYVYIGMYRSAWLHLGMYGLVWVMVYTWKLCLQIFEVVVSENY